MIRQNTIPPPPHWQALNPHPPAHICPPHTLHSAAPQIFEGDLGTHVADLVCVKSAILLAADTTSTTAASALHKHVAEDRVVGYRGGVSGNEMKQAGRKNVGVGDASDWVLLVDPVPARLLARRR